MRISDWSSDVCSSDLQRPKAVLTHPDRLYWPDAGVTKAGLADYYAEVWPHIAPYVTGRPLSLVRCPGGITEHCFFQKHAWKGLSKRIRQTPDPKTSSQTTVPSTTKLERA